MLTTCCWLLCCKAVTNLSHWSSDTSRSSKASFRLYTVLSLRTSASCLRVNTSRLRSWSNNPKSGSMMFARSDFSLDMLAKMWAESSKILHSTVTLQNWYAERFHDYIGHRRRSLWGPEARASSEFKAGRHAMERASPEFLPSNAVRPQIDVLDAFFRKSVAVV